MNINELYLQKTEGRSDLTALFHIEHLRTSINVHAFKSCRSADLMNSLQVKK